MKKTTRLGSRSRRRPLTSDIGEDVVLLFASDDPRWSPVWGAALAAFMGFEAAGLGWRWSGRFDLQPMAKALATEAAVPDIVKRYISTAMVPHSQWGGPILSIRTPKNKNLRRKMEEIGIRQAILEEYLLQKSLNVKTEAIASYICDKFKIERSQFFEIKKLKRDDLLNELRLLFDSRPSRKK